MWDKMHIYEMILLQVVILGLSILPSCQSFQIRVQPPRIGSIVCRLATNDETDNKINEDPPTVLCVGETLYDSLPDAIFLGGATTNVGVHLASMGTYAAVVTCLGSDQLGKEAVRRLQVRGVNTKYIQEDAQLNTGMVTAVIDENGDADYTFDTPAAWDKIVLTNDLKDLLDEKNDATKVTVIGTIASRLGSEQGATSAATIMALRNLAKEDSVVLDVNLRPPWYDPEFVLKLSRGDDSQNKKLALVKLNDDELPIVEEWCGLRVKDENSANNALSGDGLKQRMEALAESLNARRVCVTRGENGAALWCSSSSSISADDDVFVEQGGYLCQAEPGFDTVGAGDSFLAALIRSLLLEQESADKALDRACALGGYVAKCRGAVPDHSKAPEELKQIFSFGRKTE